MLLGAGAARAGAAVPVPFTSAPVADPTAAPFTAHGTLRATFSSGNPSRCSATSLTSANHRLILTAAHCVTDGKGRVAPEILFVPAYGPLGRPYGTWSAERAFVPRQWLRREDDSFDFAAVALASNDGLLINDAVGSLPLAANFDPAQQTYTAIGYPRNFFDGQQMWRCDSPFAGYDESPDLDPAPIAIGCDMGGGASGGAWVISGGGIGSVTGYDYESEPGLLYGPYFGNAALALVRRAERFDPGQGIPEDRFSGCVRESRGCTHKFSGGALPVLRFVDRDRARTSYRVCVDEPGGGRTCANSRTAARGKADLLAYEPASVGSHTARWYVKGDAVASWSFDVGASD